MKSVEVKNLNLQFGQCMALKDINFDLDAGDYMSIVGPNGAGKSSLIKILLGLIDDYTGDVSILGDKPSKLSSKDIGYVPQIKTLDRTFPAMAIELVASGIYSKWSTKIKSSDKELLLNALQEVGIEHLAYRQLGRLSGGELQRVYLARSFVRRPRILFLDEPGTGIDVKAEKDMCHIIEKYKKHEEITVIVVTHDWNYAYYHSDKVLMINRSQHCFASPQEAFREEILRELFGHIGHSHTMKFGVNQ